MYVIYHESCYYTHRAWYILVSFMVYQGQNTGFSHFQALYLLQILTCWPICYEWRNCLHISCLWYQYLMTIFITKINTEIVIRYCYHKQEIWLQTLIRNRLASKSTFVVNTTLVSERRLFWSLIFHGWKKDTPCMICVKWHPWSMVIAYFTCMKHA